MQNTAKIHQKRLQTYHDYILNKRGKDRSLYTAQYWTNYLIVINRKHEPILPRGKSIYFKPKMIESDRNIGQKIVMSIHEFFIDRDDPAHLVYQAIHDMEGIGHVSSEGDNGMGQLSSSDLSVDGSATI